MEKTIAAFEARRHFGRILQDVAVTGNKVIVERHGQPIAAVVPIQVYEGWKRMRDNFFDKIEAGARRSGLTPEEAEVLVAEEIQRYRAGL